MKELSIEQKAKAYDEAIEKAKKHYENCKQRGNLWFVEDMEDMFPELKESEDEKIRKELLNAFQESEDSLYMVLTPHRRESFIAWLEKQGEKKEIDYNEELKKCKTNPLYFFDKYVKGKFKEQKPAEWSEEDEEMHRRCICAMRASACGFPEEEKFVEQVDNWFKSLKDRVQPQPQSDERNRLLGKLEEWLDEYVSNLADVDTATLICSFTNYLDGKLPKSLRLQNTWKPSDEQISCLYDAVARYNQEGFSAVTLTSLLEQLKKLR